MSTYAKEVVPLRVHARIPVVAHMSQDSAVQVQVQPGAGGPRCLSARVSGSRKAAPSPLLLQHFNENCVHSESHLHSLAPFVRASSLGLELI